jgi:hypothetical protein
MKSKIHCKDIGEGFWKVFITEDSWETFSFIMKSETEPTRKEVNEIWNHESVAHPKTIQKVF